MVIEVPGYTVKHKIADGGMASVYLAVQDSLQRDVALKILAAGNDDSFRQRFVNEGRLLASLSHPSIITIYDIGILADGHGYIAMEYLPGGDLASRLLQPLPAEIALLLLRQLAMALGTVHAAGIVHRDIKPANILFRGDGTPIVSDFGIARRERQDVKLTMDGHTVGSPAYSSPEQLQGKAVDARSDIYSLGVTFYQMLTASNPYSAVSFADTIVNHLHMDLPVLPATLSSWQPLINGMLAKSAEQRFENCEALIAAIDALPGVVLPHAVSGTFVLPVAVSHTIVQSPQAGGSTVASTIMAPIQNVGGRGAVVRHWLGRATLLILVLAIIGVASAAVMREIRKHQLIEQQLALADQRYAARKYLTPADDNAVLYYRKVLIIDAGNRAASEGLQNVAARYEELARKSFAANRYDRGMALIDKGLQVMPDNAALLQLKKEQQALGHPTARFFRNIFR